MDCATSDVARIEGNEQVRAVRCLPPLADLGAAVALTMGRDLRRPTSAEPFITLTDTAVHLFRHRKAAGP